MHLIEVLIELYQTTFDPRWYVAAHQLAETMIEYFRARDCHAPCAMAYDATRQRLSKRP